MEKNLSYEPGRLSENERSRLSILKLISIIFVVYIHSYANVINFRDSKIDLSDFYLVQKIELLFSNRIACFAVPLFFCISGYIFFKKNYKENYFNFIIKKSKSILLPYILWNSICIFYTFLLQILPYSSKFFSRSLIKTWNWKDWLDAYLGYDGDWMPFLYPLWFMLILYIVFLLIPVFKVVIMRYPGLIFALFFIHLFCSYFNVIQNSFFAKLIPAISFFCFGYLMIIYSKIISSGYVASASGIFFIVSCFARIFYPEFISYIPVEADSYIGVIFMISLSYYFCKLPDRFRQNIIKLSSFSFLIYVMHESALTIIKKISYSIVQTYSTSVLLLLYFTIPACLIVALIVFGNLFEKCFPAAYRFLFVRS